MGAAVGGEIVANLDLVFVLLDPLRAPDGVAAQVHPRSQREAGIRCAVFVERGGDSALDLVHGPSADDLGQRREALAQLGPHLVAPRGTQRGAEGEPRWQVHAVVIAAEHQTRFLAQLPINAAAGHVLRVGVLEERRHGRRKQRIVRREGERFALVLVVHEEMNLVLPNRAPEREAGLLIRVRQDALGDEIGGIELVVAEIPVRRAPGRIRSGFADRIHHDAAGAALRHVESRGDHLELANRFAAELRLHDVAIRHPVGDFLPIHVQLVGAHVPEHAFPHRVGPGTGRQHGELLPIATVDRQHLHLAGIDVAAHSGLCDIDQGYRARDRDRLGHACQRHAKIEDDTLPQEQFKVFPSHRSKARQLGGDDVDAGPHGSDAVYARSVSHPAERVPRVGVLRGDGHARQDGVARVGYGSGNDRVLGAGGPRHRDDCSEHHREYDSRSRRRGPVMCHTLLLHGLRE